MLKLSGIIKNYTSKEATVQVLKDITLCFRRCEFVSVLGPSGCGKTTLLNIIGGLDRYTEGDVVIDGKSTAQYTDHDWDHYRNKRIGFVFQSYNLIPHLTVQRNVEIALTLAGISKADRHRRALETLEKVGLASQARKRPNQLSGGQMQRVAIARALVNNPDIILADEPTGALDSESGQQVMELLKEVARDRLVIMVTHNPALAEEYSTRIISIKDGVVIGDTAPYSEEECDADLRVRSAEEFEADRKLIESIVAEHGCRKGKEADAEPSAVTLSARGKAELRRARRKERRKTSMSFGTAISLSATNLLSKKGRTFLTSFAGSIGIIGIIMVLALSSGAQAFINKMEEDALSQYPLEIERTNTSLTSILEMLTENDSDREEYPGTDEIYTNTVIGNLLENIDAFNTTNDLKMLKAYIEENFDESIGYVKYDYGTTFDVFCNYVGDEEKYMKVNPFIEGIADALPPAFSGMLDLVENFAEMMTVWDEMIDNQTMLEQQYDLLAGSRWPSSYDEVVIVVDEKNQLDDYTLFALGLKDPEEVINAIFNGGEFSETTYTVEELLGLEYRVVTKSDYYYQDENGDWGVVESRSQQRDIEFIEARSVPVKVVGVVRPKKNAVVTSINGRIGYTSELTAYLSARAENSPAVVAQKAQPNKDIVTGEHFNEGGYEQALRAMGVADLENPMVIKIYASSFDDKETIEAFIARYNREKGVTVKYTDNLAIMMSYVDSLTRTVTGVLVGFSAISLIVSSIMIAIIIYTSVLERRKEIGVLRSIGARKRDISHVFIAESGMIGLGSGLIGVIFAYILFMPLNLLIGKFLGVTGLITIKWWHTIMMIGISFVLAVLAGFIPSRIAAKKDPVECLRSE